MTGWSRSASRDSRPSVKRDTLNRWQARRLDSPRSLANATWRRRLGTLTTFIRHLAHRVDFKIPLGNDPLQTRILRLEFVQTANIRYFQRTVALTPPPWMVCSLTPRRLATFATGFSSASRRMGAIWSSVNRLFFISPSLALGSQFLKFLAVRLSGAGQMEVVPFASIRSRVSGLSANCG